MMDGKNGKLSIRRQAELLGVNRSSYYGGPPATESEENLAIMEFMDREYLEHPTQGVRQLVALLIAAGVVPEVNPKRVRRLRKKMGLQTVYRARRTTIPGPSSHIRPYLLRNEAVKLAGATPEILNTDQGCQYTSVEWQKALDGYQIKLSMDGKGRWVDNVMIERFWRTIKYDEIYLRSYEDGREAYASIGKYIRYYNSRRPHDSHGMKTPDAVYYGHPTSSAAA